MKVLAKSLTRYTVIVEGSIARYYDTITEALNFAKSAVYLSQESQIDMENLLEHGQIAEWSYGFNSVIIYPKGNTQ